MFEDIHLDFSKACRIDKEIVIEALHHDIDIILECHQESIELNAIVLIPFFRCVLQRKQYAPNMLYQDIISVVVEKQISDILPNLMPYINTYIEHMAK